MTEQPRTVRIVLDGDYDMHRANELGDAFPAPGAVDGVIIDCSGVTYFDSVALSALIRFRRAFLEAGGDPRMLVLVVPKGSVRKIFELAGIAACFTIVELPPDEDYQRSTGSGMPAPRISDELTQP